jgi:hypothetical protein
VKGEQRVIRSLEPELFSYSTIARRFEVLLQRVDHYVSHKTNSLARNPLGQQVFISVGRRREKQICDLIC